MLGIPPWSLLRIVAALTTGEHTVEDPSGGTVSLAWRGCEVERADRTCLTGPGSELVIWVRRSTRRLELADDEADVGERCWQTLGLGLAAGAATQRGAGFADGGCWAKLRPDPVAPAITLQDHEGRVVWSLPHAPLPVPARTRPKHETIDSLTAAIAALQTAHTEAELGELASVYHRRRQANLIAGDLAAAIADAAAARTLFDRIGWASRACDVTFAQVYLYRDHSEDPDALLAELTRGSACATLSTRYATYWRYFRAKHHELRGQLAQARRQLDGVDGMATRVQDHEFAEGVLGYAYSLAEALGEDDALRTIEVAQLATAARRLGRDAFCGRFTARTQVAWSRLMARERGLAAPDPYADLEALYAATAQEGPCTDVRARVNAAVNLALAAVQHGDYSRARALLRDIDPRGSGPEVALYYHLTLVRVAVATGDIKLARKHLSPLQAAAARSGDPRLRWHAAYATGQFERSLGDPAAAKAAFTAAEALRDDILLELTLGSARARADTAWDQSNHALAEAHLTAPVPDLRAALELLRRGQTRALQLLDARARLTAAQREALSADIQATRAAVERSAAQRASVAEERLALTQRRELRQGLRERMRRALAEAPTATTRASSLRGPARGELLLVYLPVGDHWARFADDGVALRGGLFAAPTGDDEQAWSDALLEPFADLIAKADRVRVIASGEVLAQNIHGLPLRGALLLAQVPVVYSLDLPDAAPDEGHLPRSALLVEADAGRLHEARPLAFAAEEADHVLARWARGGLVDRWLVDDEATRDNVLAALPAVDLLHFIGHGAPRQELRGSQDLWDTELLLSGASSLSVEDILGLEMDRVPAGVVLSACETALIDPRIHGGGLTIGHSFLLRGSEYVIATTRAILDAEAVQFVDQLYAHAQGGATLADPAALAATQRDLLAGQGCDALPTVCAYRMWVR